MLPGRVDRQGQSQGSSGGDQEAACGNHEAEAVMQRASQKQQAGVVFLCPLQQLCTAGAALLG